VEEADWHRLSATLAVALANTWVLSRESVVGNGDGLREKQDRCSEDCEAAPVRREFLLERCLHP